MRTRLLLLVALAVVAAGALTGPGTAGRSAADAPKPAPVWLGTWQTNKGPLVVSGSATAVSGTYGYADSSNDPLAHMTAVVNGAIMSGSWSFDKADRAPLDKGTFSVTWSWVNGQATFTGTYTYTANGTVVDWQGSCTGGACSADTTKPFVKALVTRARRGAAVALRYIVADERLNVSETVVVLRGNVPVWRTSVPLHGTFDERSVSGVSWSAPAKAAGAYRFVVTARDKAGNTATSSAAIVLR